MLNMPDTFTCSQCGAPLPVEQGRQFVTCAFCQAANFLDKRRAVLHYAVRDTLGKVGAEAALRRWMAGNDTVKGLDQNATITEFVFQLFPMWLVRAEKNGQQKIILQPGTALTVTELTDLTIPAADLEPYDATMDSQAIEATVPFTAVQTWLAQTYGVSEADMREVSLVHVPLFMARYALAGRSYTAVVDASNGRVFANVYPSKWEAPYLAIGVVAFVGYFVAALLPYLFWGTMDTGGFAVGMVAYAVACVALAVPIFAIAAYVSYKV